jgi:glycosyltransferase involved in cell wall biosynthesis
MLVHQLCREIWFYQMFFPLNLVGFILEPIYLRMLSDRKVVTISESSRNDLIRFGFKKDKIKIIGEGIELKPVNDLNNVRKSGGFLVISLGAIREMKRPDQQVLAFEIARKEIPNLKLKISGAGKGKYFENVMSLIQKSVYKNDIEYLGRITDEEKIILMQKAHIITVTSVKEGWGLIVTEANSQGTPAIVYNVDGLRDSVRDGETGLITAQNTPGALADKIVQIAKDNLLYSKLQKNAWEWSKEITLDNCYIKFIETING